MKTLGRQQGMTLIELSVVLLVLIGLAGLTLPYVSGFVSKTHNSTSSDTGVSLFSALQLYQTQNNSLPNNLNSLIDLTTSLPATYLDNTFAGKTVGTAYSGIPTNYALFAPVVGSVANAINSLNVAGITLLTSLPTGTVTPNADGTFTPSLPNGTFTPEVAGAAPALLVTDSTGLGTNIATALNYTVPTGHNLIVLGVGAANSAVGKTLANVPVHFGDKASLQPTLTYSRFLAAVDVDAKNGTAPAKIVGIVHAPDITDKWESVYSTIQGYYTN